MNICSPRDNTYYPLLTFGRHVRSKNNRQSWSWALNPEVYRNYTEGFGLYLKKKMLLHYKEIVRWYKSTNSQLDATITDFVDNYNQLNMFPVIISPVLRNTRLCLQHVL